MGTDIYQAYEFEKGNYSEKVDIFACGIILFELVFLFKTYSERKIKLTKLRSLIKENSNTIEFDDLFNNLRTSTEHSHYVLNIENLILQMCSLDPNERPSAKELLSMPLAECIDKLQ